MSAPLPPLIGTRLGDYLVESVVGRGGMATVYRARDHRLGRLVALKVLAPQLGHDPRFRDRFVRESRLVASIDHPHIIPIYEAGESNDLLFIAMRYVEGQDLRKLIQSGSPLSLPRANRLFSQIASALDAAHLNGLVHRDVKPANILVADVGQNEHVYLTDFGLTKSTYSEEGLTSQGQFMGTPRYVAPEQIRGLPVDGRSDLYAFACVVYEALTGQPPFQRDTELALLYAHVSHEPPPVTPYRPDLPHAANDVMARALAKSPTERYATCQQFVTALRDAISGAGAEPPPDAAIGGETWPPGISGAPSVPSMPNLPPGYSHAGQPVYPGQPGHPGYAGYPGAAQPARPAKRSKWLKGPLIGAAAILASLAVAAVLLFNPGESAAVWKTYQGDIAAPFSFSYPGNWAPRAHSDAYVVLSPSAKEFDALFAVPVASDWSSVNGIISGQDKSLASGILVEVSETINASDTKQLKETLPVVLPGPVGFGSEPTADSVGGRPAFKVTGTINDPQQQGRLDFIAYVVRRDNQPTALITFFCAPAQCDNDVIEHVKGSVTFTP